jgi:phospholipid transport system transporter-binding protein
MIPMSAIFALPATIMQDQAQAVADNLTHNMAQLAAAKGVSLNASALQQFDSSALAVVLACRRTVLELGGQFQVVGLPERLLALAKVYGVTELLH